MNFIYQIQYSMKRIMLDIRPLFSKLLSGIIIIFILGLAFDSKFKVKNFDVGDVLLCNADTGKQGDSIIKTFLQDKDMTSSIHFVQSDSLKEAKKMVTKEKACGVIYFPDNFSDGNENGKHIIQVYCNSYSDMKGLVIKNVLESFQNSFNALNVAVLMNAGSKTSLKTLDEVIEKCYVVDNEATTAMQYYAIAMVIMLILYGTEYGSIKIAEDFIGPLGERLKLSPINPFCQYVGKIVGLSFMVVLEAVFLILFTKFVYGVNWGNHYFWLFVIVVSTSFLATAIGAMFTIITRNYAIADVLCMTVIFGCTFLSGGFIAADFGWFKYITPNYYAKVAINTLIYNGDMQIVYNNIGKLWITITVVTFVSVIFARRNKI